MNKIQVVIDKELYKKFRTKLIQEEKTIKEFVISKILEYIKK